MGKYCIQYEGLCLTNLSKKAEQTERQMDGQTDKNFKILAQLKLRKGGSFIQCKDIFKNNLK